VRQGQARLQLELSRAGSRTTSAATSSSVSSYVSASKIQDPFERDMYLATMMSLLEKAVADEKAESASGSKKSSAPSLIPPPHKKCLSDFEGHEWKYSRDERLEIVHSTGRWDNELVLTMNEHNFTRAEKQGIVKVPAAKKKVVPSSKTAAAATQQ
jgi:hypothetical protein